MLENTWRATENSLDILRATTGAHVEVVQHSAILIPKLLEFLSDDFIFRKQFYFVVSGLEIIIGHENLDNNLESPCILNYC
jgi:hypothetical protein